MFKFHTRKNPLFAGLLLLVSFSASYGQEVKDSPNESEIPMKALWVAMNSKREYVDSGVSDLTLRIQKKNTPTAQVAFIESSLNAAGDDLKAAGWIASFVACQETDTSLNDYQFFYGLGKDTLDGPSAGMLFAATGIMAIKNYPPRPESVAITGTINPDGSVGPVSGVRHKLEAAIKQKIQYFGYPVGSRLEYDDDGQIYDLIDIAKRASSEEYSINVVEIRDVNDAVTLLTGVTHPSPLTQIIPTVALPDLSLESVNRIRSGILSLKSETTEIEDRIDEIRRSSGKDFYTPGWEKDVTGLKDMVTQADTLLTDGLAIRSYYQMLQARAVAGDMLKNARLAKKFKQSPRNLVPLLNEAIKIYNESEQRVESMRLSLRDQASAKSFSAKVDALNAEILLCEARSNLYSGLDNLKLALRIMLDDPTVTNAQGNANSYNFNNATTDVVYKMLKSSLWYCSLGETRAIAVRDWFSFSRHNDGVVVNMPDSQFEVQASGYVNGAGASLNYFKKNYQEKVVNEKVLAACGFSAMSKDQTENCQDYIFGRVESMYPPLKYAAGASQARMRALDDREQSFMNKASIPFPSYKYDNQPITALGFAAYSYTGLANLLFKHYTFGGGFDDQGNLILKNRKALGVLLDIARDRAIRKQMLVQNVFGETPDSIMTNLSLGDSMRYATSDEDRMQAFSAYWRVTLLCDFSMKMKRFVVLDNKNDR